MIAPFAVQVTLHRRTLTGARNSYGDATYTDATTATWGVFNPGASSGPDNTAVDLQPVVYLPAGTDVSYLDAVTVNGTTYEVDGNPNDWQHPLTGWHAGIEVHLRTVERPS